MDVSPISDQDSRGFNEKLELRLTVTHDNSFIITKHQHT